MDKFNESDIHRNSLDKSSSPYLLQHTGNPVWWQEWSDDLIKYSLEVNKPLLVSIGYATCHWCHVMAREAFSDKYIAQYLNDNFICIKVDREQRTDIDQYMMAYINKQSGRGGWPLNVFLTPDLRPFFALTYAPAKSGDSMHSFLTIAEKVFEFYETNREKIPQFIMEEELTPSSNDNSIILALSEFYDSENGGFGRGQKFPSHSTLLYLLYQLSVDNSPSIKTICSKTLDAIRLRGLHDHLQGGIFRYCVDPEWTIPHFEKMLYDQAMVLWCYSLAYKVIGKDEYRKMALNVLKCLDESFKEGGFYISAHDADTDHEEGATYLWSYEQLKKELLPEDFEKLVESYYINKEGNFEHMIHLIRLNDNPLDAIESKLLSVRRKREQPSRDGKILSGINILVAIGMLQASRYLDLPDLAKEAGLLVKTTLNRFWNGKSLAHSYFNGTLQQQDFLSDVSAMLIVLTMLYEDDPDWKDLMTSFTTYVESFKDGDIWIEAKAPDFQPVNASSFDHPVPSGVSMAEMGLTRVALLTGRDAGTYNNKQPFQSDFYNLNVMITNGLFHVYTSRKFIPWNLLPANSLQLRGANETDCFKNVCHLFDTRHL